ncbi:MAG: Gfo/Idh/MocA family oxidoreductase [Bacteroidota bacterium]
MRRRKFIGKSGAALAGVASFSIVPSHVFGKALGHVAPSDKVNLAGIGIGHRGGSILRSLHETGIANVVALCDVDMDGMHTAKSKEQFAAVARFTDFRKMFDEIGDDIEAVSVGTPDFSHFPITMLAMSLGKHVYVEKPLARTFNEIELMMAGAKTHGVVTQMGNQGHSGENYFQFKAWKEAGVINDVTAMTAHMNNARRWHGFDPRITSFPAAEQLPEQMDWDVWLNTAQWHNYNKDFHHGQWRCWYDFGMGALGDWGAHIMDTAHQFLDLGLPYEVNPTLLSGHNSFFFPFSSTIEFKFPERKEMPAMQITWYDGTDNIPPVPKGYGVSEIDPNIPPPSNGALQPAKLNPGKIIYGKDLTFKGGTHSAPLKIIPEEAANDMASTLPNVPESPSNHFANFLKACKGEEEARSSFEIAGPLSQVFCLGVIAQQLSSKLLFDRETKTITNNKFANELLTGTPPRQGWEEYYQMA